MTDSLYTLGPWGKVRLGTSTMPVRRSDGDVFEERFETSVDGLPPSVAYVEVLVPHGGMASYALLGGSWQPGPTPNAEIHLVTGLLESVYTDSLALNDTVLVGVANEFREPVLAELRAAPHTLGAGRLSVDIGATATIGSSGFVFGACAEALLALLARGRTGALDALSERFGLSVASSGVS